MMRKLMICAAGLLSVIAAPAWAAECNLALQGGSNQLTTYDPFAASDEMVVLELNVTNSGPDTCQARLFVEPTSGQRVLIGGADQLSYRFDGTPSGSGTGPFFIDLAPGATRTLPVRVILDKQQVVPRGTYTADLQARLEPMDDDVLSAVPLGFAMNVQVPARVEMSISGLPSTNIATSSMAPAAIDLQEMYEGQVGRAYVNVWSNGSVTVSLWSDNDGRLLLDGRPTAPAVNYTASFDGQPVSFPASIGRSPPMSITGAAYELAVTVGSLQGRFAGRYSDTITVEVRQN
jgi:hypothetical protein